MFTALAVLSAKDMNLATLYADVIVTELPMALRKTAEEELRAKTREYGSDFARSYHAQGKAEGKAEGREEGLAEGRAAGKAEGRAEGETKGKAEGEAIAVLAVLRARGIAVTRDQESQVKNCTDLDRLNGWLQRAATAESADQVFA